MTRKTLTRTLPALVWALALLALGAALLVALGDASAQQPPISASIVDDNDQNTNSLCGGFVWSDGHCDLRIRITDHDATDSQATIVVSDIYSGAFDASVITPDDSALSSQALGPTPTTYTIPGNTRQIFRLRMTPVVTASGAQYYEGYVRVHHGAGTNGRKLAEYKLTLQAPTPTSVTSESITSTSFAVRWKMDERARRTIIFWRPRDGGSPEQSVQVTMVQNAKYRIISGLQSSTCYVARVQPLLDGKSIESAEVEVATLADPDATDPPADPCAVLTSGTMPPPVGPDCSPDGTIDSDNDGLIEICNLEQLNAIRHDLNGDGVPDPEYMTKDTKPLKWSERYGAKNSAKRYIIMPGDYTAAERLDEYRAAFGLADGVNRISCSSDSGCKGFELAVNLDFDTGTAGDRTDDLYWNGGKGWIPIIGQTYRSYWHHSINVYYRFFGGTGTDRGSNVPANLEKMFRAVFEGNGHTIANLYINDPSTPSGSGGNWHIGPSESGGNWHTGLFGYVGRGGEIRNVGLTVTPGSNSMVDGGGGIGRGIGTLVGVLQDGIVRASYSHVPINTSATAGGLIGLVWRGLVVESYATGDVVADVHVGGLIGRFSGGDVKASFASGAVTTSSAAGGLVGYREWGNLTASYAAGAVTVASPPAYHQLIGGLVGFFAHNWRSTVYIRASYATGAVQTISTNRPGRDNETKRDAAGGLVGICASSDTVSDQQRANIRHSYWDTVTTGQDSSACGAGYTTTELQAPTGYTGIYSAWNLDIDGDNTPDDPWDFGTASEYPILDYCAAKPGIDLSWDTTRTEYCPLREATQHGRTYK